MLCAAFEYEEDLVESADDNAASVGLVEWHVFGECDGLAAGAVCEGAAFVGVLFVGESEGEWDLVFDR